LSYEGGRWKSVSARHRAEGPGGRGGYAFGGSNVVRPITTPLAAHLPPVNLGWQSPARCGIPRCVEEAPSQGADWRSDRS